MTTDRRRSFRTRRGDRVTRPCGYLGGGEGKGHLRLTEVAVCVLLVKKGATEEKMQGVMAVIVMMWSEANGRMTLFLSS